MAIKENPIEDSPKSGDSNANDDRLVQWLFLRLAGRLPDDSEGTILRDLLNEQRTRFAKDPENSKRLIKVGESVSESANAVNLAATTVLAQAIMNCDATIWKR